MVEITVKCDTQRGRKNCPHIIAYHDFESVKEAVKETINHYNWTKENGKMYCAECSGNERVI